MCGIAGFLLARPGRAPAECEALLWAMLAPVRHRGPDDQGVWSDGEAGLAHARLSIIDLSPAGHQPMASQDGMVWLTYNGEIYNFAELRAELIGRGYVFRSRTDSEVIVNGWHAWGPQLFTRLRGMFALALWDRRSRRLILARDRVGKKPLYYARTAAGVVFGSEIKALLAWPGIARTPDLAAIDQYLSLQYVPAPATAFAGIGKLPPAHYLVLGGDGDGEPARYWTLPAPGAGGDTRPVAALERELVALVDEAVRIRLVSDVPLGAFLSGGVDSSSVVAAMARVGGGRVKTFSIGFADPDYDESAYARLVADRLGTEHEELIVEPDAVAVLPQLVWHYGEPFADPSAIPTWYVAAMARRHVTVALNGDGGDEAFLGYPRYQAMRHLARLDRFPAAGRWALEKMLAAAPDAAARAFRLAKIRAVLRAPAARPAQRYGALLAVFDDDAKAAGYGAALHGRLDRSALDLLAPYFAADGLLAGANRADLNTYLPDDLMVKVDVATMAHGLEARSPLLDHVLLEWAARLPVAARMAGGTTKALLKSAMAPYLPAAVRARRKQGFGMPVGRWFRNELKSLAYDTLLSQAARQRGLFRPDYVQTLLDDHCAGRANHPTRLWTLLMLELWFGMWIDAAPESAVLRPAA